MNDVILNFYEGLQKFSEVVETSRTIEEEAEYGGLDNRKQSISRQAWLISRQPMNASGHAWSLGASAFRLNYST